MRQEAEALVGAGHRVTVVSPTGADHDSPDELLAGVRAVRFPAPPEGGGAAGYLKEYAVALRRMRAAMRRALGGRTPDLVICANPPDFLVLLALGAARRGARIVFDHHDLSPELFEAKFGRRGPFHRVLLAAERFAFRRADVVLSSNDSYARIARERGGVPPERVFVVRNGPDPARLFPVDPDPELRRGRRHLVLWLGRMSEQEGLGVVVDAAERLARDDVTFALVGPGDARARIQAEVERRGLAGMFDLPGPVGDDGVRAYLSTADVCLSVDPSSEMNERSTMIKVLEYMAMGRPVVQFPLEEMRLVCGDATVYAREGDAADLAARIGELLNDPERRGALGAAARERIAESFLWPQQVPRLIEAVETALAAKRGA